MEIKILGFKARVEVIILSMIIGCLLCCHLICGCATKEGMEVAGSAIGYSMAKGVHRDSYDERAGLLEVNGGGKIGPQVPLPEGQLFMYANNDFDAKCCATSNVSGANGCACITKEQQCYLNSRGGNRTSDSEY